MDGSPSPEASSKEVPLIEKPWREIRNAFESTPYSELYQAGLRRIQEWEKTPRQSIDPKDWSNSIKMQIQKATEIPHSQRIPGTYLWEEKDKKIWSQGDDVSKDDSPRTLTRLYIATDPRNATDAYLALLRELSSNGVISNIQVALNTEELFIERLVPNNIIIYEEDSRPEVLDKVLAAYRKARSQNPKLFELSPRQKASVMRANLRNFKAILDSNTAFVEMAPEDKGRSYDSGIVQQTAAAYGIGTYATDEEALATIQKKEKKGVVLTTQDHGKVGHTKPGDILHYKRRLSAPSLVTQGEIVMK